MRLGGWGRVVLMNGTKELMLTRGVMMEEHCGMDGMKIP